MNRASVKKKLLLRLRKEKPLPKGNKLVRGEDLDALHPYVWTLSTLPYKVIFYTLPKLCIKEEKQETGPTSLTLEKTNTETDRLSQRLA